MTWIQIDTKVVCENTIEFDNPVLKGRKFQVRPGRQAQIVEIPVEGLVRIGWFDFGTGRREGYVEHNVQDLLHFWKPFAAKTPVAPREPRPMVVSMHPDKPGVHGLPHIGYWAESQDPLKDRYETKRILLPWPGDFLDPEWRGHEKNMVIVHLRDAPNVEHWRGFSSCRLCTQHHGSTDKSDGAYVWPSGLAHYVEEHSLRPPPEFVSHIIRYNNRAAGVQALHGR
jgi:hypothetical protein